ncbi:WW domain binding protein 1-like [Lytechinus variegatus]|uniref:WW domain binding protein 1-like n=1 Tax=Lytechinus variegatus TaxID=7654 RepID=UPI001BB1F8D3|nr:WW domain binding protein 1-like [Lytechinus variegatus]
MASYSDQLFSGSTGTSSSRMGVYKFLSPLTVFLAVFSQRFEYTQAREFCQVEGYWCETGHCCGSGECCTYYYELWWFWLVWFLIVFIIGFCVWQRKRFHPWRDNRCERTCSIQDMFLGRGYNFPDVTPVPPCKLPSYSEIGETVSYDTPPPPYNVEAAIPCLGEGPSTSLPAGGNHCPPPHRGLQAITQSLSSLNSTPTCSPSDAPPSYSQIIGSSTPVFASMPNTQILTQPRLSTGTQFPEQLQQQLRQQQNEEHQNQNNSGSNTTLNSPSTPGRPLSTTVTQVSGVVATCACGSPLRSPVITPHSRMLPPPVPASPKTTVVSMAQRPQHFLSPHGSPQRFTTAVVTSSSQSSSSTSNTCRQNSVCVGHSPAGSGTPLSHPGTAVRSSSLVDDSQGDDPSNGHTVVDMRTSSRRGLGFLSRWRHLR